jgi:hypothetical protein
MSNVKLHAKLPAETRLQLECKIAQGIKMAQLVQQLVIDN